MTDKYKDWIVRYYASHEDIPEGQYDGHVVRELIRCKDCIHNYGLERNESYNPFDIVCLYWDSDGLTDEDYCSHAERKTDNG